MSKPEIIRVPSTPQMDKREKMLRKAWQSKRSEYGNVRIAVVRDIRDFQQSQMVECELGVGSDEITGGHNAAGTGKTVNAWAWSQAEIKRGQEVFITRLAGLQNRHWVVLGVKGPSLGQLARNRENDGDIVLYSGKPFRTPKVPRRHGAWRVLPRTQKVANVHKVTYTRIICTVRFSKAFNPAFIPQRFTYSLFAYPHNDPPLGAAPPFRMDLLNRVNNRRIRQSMMFSDDRAAWLDKRRKVTFVLAAVRRPRLPGVPPQVRAKGLGLIDRVLIKMDNHLDPDDLFDGDPYSEGEGVQFE